MDCKGEKTMEDKKRCCVDDRSRDGRNLFFQEKKQHSVEERGTEIISSVQKICANDVHTQVSERMVQDLQSLEHLKDASTDKSFILFSQKLMMGV